jgi:tetratricopeptide (TPR) repeat protein
LEDEHALRVAHLRNQLREEWIRRFGLRLRVGFQLFVALVATVIGMGFAVMIRDAISSRRVVIEPFQTPASLAARGLTGTVVAGAVLDELTRLQNATRTSAAAKRNLSNAWASDVRLSVPETGISLDDLSRYLRARYGHDLHIGGDLVESRDGGLAITVRGDAVPAKTFTGGADDLDKLAVETAHYVYAEAQPVLWAIYLEGEFRFAEEITFIKSVYASVNPADRPYLLNSWANVLPSLEHNKASIQESVRLYQTAIKLKPDYWVAYANVQGRFVMLGDEEDAWRAGERLRNAAGRPGPAYEPYFGTWDALTWNLLVELNALQADADAHSGLGTSGTANGPQIAQVEVLLHDPDAAALMLETVKADKNDPTVVAGMHMARGLLATETGHTSEAVSQMEAFRALIDEPSVYYLYMTLYTGNACWVAPAEEAAGHPERADAAIQTGGRFVDCYRFRGDILDGRGDWSGAQKAYADAVALGPDLPSGYYSWGIALARHGDLTRAEAKLQDANQRGPHWAEPLKAWGDVLARQGKVKDALAKYDEAIKYSPNWRQLIDAREAARQRS